MNMTLYKGAYRIESARLAVWDYRQPGWYFATLCAKGSQPYFGFIRDGKMCLSQAGEIAEHELRSVPLHYNAVSLDSHIVMPNHVHAVVCIDGIHAHSPEGAIEEWRIKLESDSRHLPSLGSIIGGYKSAVARKCHAVGIASFAWQARFYDHIIRGNHAVAAVREYIRNNPQNWDRGSGDDHPDWNLLLA